jgi:hypothetical protein
MKALWMSMILSSVSALGPSLVWANGTCGPLFAMEYAMNGRVMVEEGALSGPTASTYAAMITKIDSFLSGLARPTETNFVVHDMMMFSSFNPIEAIVYVGLRPVEGMNQKHENINLTTLIHEYGHAILEKNLRAQIPGFAKISLQMHNNSNEKFVPFIIHSGLHELFADAVTLVTTKNPDALPELLMLDRKAQKQFEKELWLEKKKAKDPSSEQEEHSPIPKEYSRETLALRGMSDGNSHHAYQKWQELLQDEFVRIDPYFIFLPTRWHLWQTVKTRIDSPNYQRKILGKIFPIIREEMNNIHLKAPENLSAAEIEAINLRLIQKIDEALF